MGLQTTPCLPEDNPCEWTMALRRWRWSNNPASITSKIKYQSVTTLYIHVHVIPCSDRAQGLTFNHMRNPSLNPRRRTWEKNNHRHPLTLSTKTVPKFPTMLMIPKTRPPLLSIVRYDPPLLPGTGPHACVWWLRGSVQSLFAATTAASFM